MEIGVDIVDLKRLNIHNRHFIERILTPSERELFEQKKTDQQKAEFLGGRFAAKEAYSKALGTGIGPISFQQIEVLNDELGKPYLNGVNAKISISHEKEYAVAFVVIL
ncbi:holo-ACP synthase [Beduini massiliensis]|uniref:holo-ACP synthase n=1 Tax=Beduini massiliensis TaxID=1585974 RepID=UPI00059A9C43|nr:holo-ACP synthase [Beduini massiliensis]